MPQTKARALAALEIYAIVKEIEKDITNSIVKKIYQLNNRVYFVLHRGTDFMLLIAPERIHLTNYKEKFPLEPSNFVMQLRKHLDGAILKSVRQHEFERIVVFEFSKKEVSRFIMAEMFGDGNVLLLDSGGKIMAALKQRSWKDRDVKRGLIYSYPPATENLLELTEKRADKILSDSKLPVVRAIARNFGLGGLYAEEICLRLSLEKMKSAAELNSDAKGKIYAEIKSLFREVSDLHEGFQYLKDEKPVELSPIKLKSFSGFQEKSFPSFSQACDEYFVKEIISEISSAENKIREKYEFRLKMQKASFEETVLGIERMKQEADAFSMGQDFRQAAELYDKVKKGRKKIIGLEKAIKKTEVRLSTLKFEEKIPVKKDRKEKEWFEKFRSFETSGGFLVVCGKDASTNDLLIKKYTVKNDVVFHADIQGAPFCAIKTEGKKVPEKDLEETAVIAACYSKAWQRGLGTADVYWVNPEQLSKKAPAGEFVATGAFVVYGKKNFFYSVPLKIFIGINRDLKIMAGAESYVKERALFYSAVSPGDEKSKEVAEKIRHAWLKKAGKEVGQKIKAINIEEIQKFVPSGKGRVI